MLKNIITLVLILIIVGQLYLLRQGRSTLSELEDLKHQAECRIDSLRVANDSLDVFSHVLVTQVDSLAQEIIQDEKQLQRVKDDYKKRVDYISKLSSNELTEYFSNRYNNQ
jgi:cell division protein FtsB